MLESIESPGSFYTGITKSLKRRLEKHNNGESKYTSKLKPWKINTFVAFTDKSKACSFEKYLKSHSGRAFSKKHF